MPQKILKPNASEEKWIQANLGLGQELVRTFAPSSAGAPASLRSLDEAFAAWLAQHDPAKEDPNPMINAFGIAFGQHFVDKLHFSWAVVSDEHGTEMAVHGSPGDIIVYPPNFVAKRYTSKATGFFESTFAEMKRDVERVRSAPAKATWWKFWDKAK